MNGMEVGATHLHNWALGALVERSGTTKTDIARRAGLTPSGLGDFISGRRAGTSPELRARLADALDTDVRAITCHCDDRQGNHQ